jgi:hypothetical protein
MKKAMLAQLAMAGITSGLLALSAQADSTSVKKAVKKKTAAKADTTASAVVDTTAKAAADTSAKAGKAVSGAKTEKQKCKGLNACKGQGGCAMSDKDIAAAAKKMGIPVEKAGKSHGCKGHNECKGLGGCNM